MGTCINCGKKGLFLKVNNRGLCNECELQFVKDKPEEHYRTLLTLFTSIRETVSMPEDPIERLGYIDKLEKKLLECKRLKEEAEKIQGNKTLGKYIIRRTIYKSASDASLGRSILENFDNLTIWTGKYTADDPCKKLSEELIKKSEKYFDGWQRTINMVKNNAEFEKELREIPEVEIKKSHKSVEMKSTVDLEFLVKYSRITTKTNYNRIGNFVVIDTETTGLSSLKDAITEIRVSFQS